MAEEKKKEEAAPTRESGFMHPDNVMAAGSFVNGPIWRDMRRALMARHTEWPNVQDEPHVAAAKGFQMKAFTLMLDSIEKLPFDQPAPPPPPPIPETLLDTVD